MNKNVSRILAVIILITGAVGQAEAQREKRQPVGCMDPAIRQQAETIKQHYTSQGFKVARDAMINMESMVPFEVLLQLRRGQLYEIIFVGNARATNHKMMVYDGDDNKIDEKFVMRRHGDAPTNYMIYEIIPERSDTYLFEFMTRLKNEHTCGSVCILTTEGTTGRIEYKPYVP